MTKTAKTEINAYAKINLALNVLEKDGKLHKIDSIMTNINIFDKIWMQKRTDEAINITYTNINTAIENDTAKKIVLLLQKEYGTDGVDVLIEKHIPFNAGLGGSSADAAGVARCMQKLFNIGSIPYELLLQIGSDLPYMYEGGTKRVRNKGEVIEDVSVPEAYYAIVVCPGGVSTAEAYLLFDSIGGECCDIDKMLNGIQSDKDIKVWNALQKAATVLNPEISKGLELLKKAGFKQISMTGSGSAVFGRERNLKHYDQSIKILNEILPAGYTLYRS